MNEKIREIIGVIELGLLSLLPNYSVPSTTIQIQQQPSALENILESSKPKKSNIISVYNPDPNKNYSQESYSKILEEYMRQHIESKEDMSSRVSLKWLNILPESMMGGVLGFTYLGENFMGRRADLTGKTARMVDIHESIHTPDEYETRVLTSWIMEKVKGKYSK